MRVLACSVVLTGLFLHTGVQAQIPGLPVIDFQRFYPHQAAVSKDPPDKDYPHGLKYKFLSVRDEQEHVVILALVRHDPNGRVTRVFLAQGPVDGSETTFRSAVEKFTQATHIEFEFFDLRDVHTPTDFAARAEELGWEVHPTSK